MREQAIPTLYKGIRFRSRLEATWARFFDELQWPWEYEPVDLNGYIPDFILPLQWNLGGAGSYRPVLVEVKPALSLEELRGFTGKIETSGWQQEALVLGACLLESAESCHSVLGLLGERTSDEKWWWEKGETMRCQECQRLSFFHSMGWYGSRVCGHYDGDGLLGDGNEAFKKAWAEAKNHSQWAKSYPTK